MKIFLILLISIYLNANTLDNSIKNYIGESQYQRHAYLIKKIFKNKNHFYNGDKLKYSKIFERLNENGLLHLKFLKAKKIKIEIESISSSIQTIKIIKDVLNDLGYSYYFTDRLEKDGEKLVWEINLKSESMLSPFEFTSKLDKLGVHFENVRKISSTKWKYKIDLNYASIANTIKIQRDEELVLKKPHEPYLFELSSEMKVLNIKSRVLNTWYPYISFYDKDLELLGSSKKTKIFKSIKVNIPENTKYVSLGDTFTLLNIKRGLTVVLR